MASKKPRNFHRVGGKDDSIQVNPALRAAMGEKLNALKEKIQRRISWVVNRATQLIDSGREPKLVELADKPQERMGAAIHLAFDEVAVIEAVAEQADRAYQDEAKRLIETLHAAEAAPAAQGS